MKSLPLYLLLTVSYLFFFPQNLDAQVKYKLKHKVYLSNGWVLQGDTSLVEGKKSLKISTPDHQTFIFPLQEVDSILIASFKPSRKSEMGYRSIVHIGIIGRNTNPNARESANTLFFQYTGSYTTLSGLSIGLGSGVNLYERGYVIPVYADFRTDLSRGLVRPHLYAQIGTSLPIYKHSIQEDRWTSLFYEDFDADGGLLLEIGAGLKFLARENYSFFSTVGWRFQEITEKYKQWETRYKDIHSLRRISVQIGCMF